MSNFREMTNKELKNTNGGCVIRTIIKVVQQIIKQQPPPMFPKR